VRVKFDMPRDVAVAPGTYAEVLVPEAGTASRGVLAIPPSAVVSRGGLTMVFSVTDDNRADLRFVRLGEPIGPDLVRVLAGLKEGDRVVRQPPPGLTSGAPIAP
jgi:multidrug efflux pump subunit AcrA (membrane-fusion protein)